MGMRSRISRGSRRSKVGGRKAGSTKLKITGNGKIGAARKLKNRNVVVGLFIGVAILVLVLVGLVVSSFGFFEGKSDPEMFVVRDECGLMAHLS